MSRIILSIFNHNTLRDNELWRLVIGRASRSRATTYALYFRVSEKRGTIPDTFRAGCSKVGRIRRGV